MYLPDTFVQCLKLRSFVIKNCPKIQSLPEVVVNCQVLTILDAVNSLKQLPYDAFTRDILRNLFFMNKPTLEFIPPSI